MAFLMFLIRSGWGPKSAMRRWGTWCIRKWIFRPQSGSLWGWCHIPQNQLWSLWWFHFFSEAVVLANTNTIKCPRAIGDGGAYNGSWVRPAHSSCQICPDCFSGVSHTWWRPCFMALGPPWWAYLLHLMERIQIWHRFLGGKWATAHIAINLRSSIPSRNLFSSFNVFGE